MLPGVWRLRLPLPWPGVPHCNAWALAAGSGVVLVDTGMHLPGSLDQLERALEQVNLRLEHVRLVVCTHAHSDHWGQAAPILERAGCELWMHPNHAHATRVHEDRELVPGVSVETDLGEWSVLETPGHAPSHVSLFQPQRRLLISGDHLLGRISLFYDYGWSPDPAGEFLRSLDVVDALDARLCLSGHGKPFVDVHGHVEGNRRLVAERLQAVHGALAPDGGRTVVEIIPQVYDEPMSEYTATWWLSETLSYLRHLEVTGVAIRDPGEEVDVWRLAER